MNNIARAGKETTDEPEVSTPASGKSAIGVDVTFEQIGEGYRLEDAIDSILNDWSAAEIIVSWKARKVTVAPLIFFGSEKEKRIGAAIDSEHAHIAAVGEGLARLCAQLTNAFVVSKNVGITTLATILKDAKLAYAMAEVE
jgi:hypothetical protein